MIERCRTTSLACLFVSLLTVTAAHARDSERGIAAVVQAMRRLENDLRVLNLATHPDDEDGATIAFCSHVLGAKASTLYANKGEGGQNETGPELYLELGALREAETLRAAAILGTDPYFLNLTDFGFSKSAEEAFRFWGGEDHVTELVVGMIRALRPHIIFTNHNTEDGHGQHRAFAIAARKAFTLAADPTAYPAQIAQGLTPWQAERFLTRVSGTTPWDFELDVGSYDAATGLTCEEIAARALREHRTQGQGGRDPLPRESIRRFQVTASIDPHGHAFPQHWRQLPPALQPWSQMSPVEVSRPLLGLLAEWRTTLFDHELGSEANDAIAAAAHVALRAQVRDALVVAGEKVNVDAVVHAPGPSVLAPSVTVSLIGRDGLGITSQSVRLGQVARFELPVTDAMPLGWPRWRYAYAITSPHGRELLYLEARVPLRIDGTAPVDLALPVNVAVAPRIELKVLRSPVPRFVNGGAPVLNVRVTQHGKEPLGGELEVLLDGAPDPIAKQSFAPLGEDQSRELAIELPRDGKQTKVHVRVVTASTPVAAEDFVTIVPIDVQVRPETRVGLIPSYDDTMRLALHDLGLGCDLLAEGDLASGDLARYDTILIDIRAYLVRADLRANHARLLDYVRGGGKLVVMYHKTGEWNPKENAGRQYAPYRLEVTSARTSEEDAPITMLQPDHPLLRLPNAIGASDFDGWVQERGLYFPDQSYDPQYAELLECHDHGEAPRKGGLLVASYGKGTYIYCAYALYRQIRAAVPGGYRLLANLISKS